MDLGLFVECNNCGVKAKWEPPTKKGDTRSLPTEWVLLKHTIANEAHFCGLVCRDAWTASREWYVPPIVIEKTGVNS